MKSIETQHKDLVHDVSYDFYGSRFATCSSDQTVRIWDRKEDNEWFCSSSFKAHSGSVWRVSWAHPEFGQIIATCSFDRTVSVWEEKQDDSVEPNHPMEPGRQERDSWVRRANLVDSRTSVTDVKFAPKHLGLLLATCSVDGTLRIYEAPDIMSLSQWNLQHDLNTRMPCSCLSWNPSPFHVPMIAVGSDEPSAQEVTPSSIPTSNVESKACRVQVYECVDNARRWVRVDVALAPVVLTDPVHDIAFASSVGKDYHLLAVATSVDVKIVAIKDASKEQQRLQEKSFSRDDRESILSSTGFRDSTSAYFTLHHKMDCNRYILKVLASFQDHGSKVWRLSWNMTGTVLASSGEDACIRLWKSNYLDAWKGIGIIRMDGGPDAMRHFLKT